MEKQFNNFSDLWENRREMYKTVSPLGSTIGLYDRCTTRIIRATEGVSPMCLSSSVFKKGQIKFFIQFE